MSATSASKACSRSSMCLSWIASTRALSSSSGHLWQPWHARFRFSTGLRTQWSETLVPPTRMYGMWQSAQATPERAWMPWFHISNSGCCALSVGAPDSLCVQSRNPISS